jgi:trehalose/maltose transport system permease protein
MAQATLERRRARVAWLFLSPALVVTAFVALYPLVRTLYLSLTNTRLGALEPARFVGLGNYAALARDGFFADALLLTVLFAVITLSFELVLGLGIALLLDARFKGRAAVRAAMLIPWAIPTAVSTQMWKWMFNDIYGVFNSVLVDRLRLLEQPIAFVADERTSLATAVCVDVWKTTPFVALLVLAGLQLIPRELYECARMDGATPLQVFSKITLPLLRPALLVTLVFRTLDALRVFDVFYVLFGSRPDMQTLATYAHEILVSLSDVGYGSAISVAIFFVIAIFIGLYVALFARGDE